MTSPIGKFTLGFVLAISSIVTVGCSPGGFRTVSSAALPSVTPATTLPRPEGSPPNTSSDSTVVPNQPQTLTQISLVGASANDLFSALERTGVVDSGMLGANLRVASEIECNTPVAPNPVTTCRVYTNSSILNMSPSDASKVNLLLSTSGGRVNSDTLGATTYRVYKISCRVVAYPGATPTCSLSTTQE